MPKQKVNPTARRLLEGQDGVVRREPSRPRAPLGRRGAWCELAALGLELRAGVPLVLRTTRHRAPTDAGLSAQWRVHLSPERGALAPSGPLRRWRGARRPDGQENPGRRIFVPLCTDSEVSEVQQHQHRVLPSCSSRSEGWPFRQDRAGRTRLTPPGEAGLWLRRGRSVVVLTLTGFTVQRPPLRVDNRSQIEST